MKDEIDGEIVSIFKFWCSQQVIVLFIFVSALSIVTLDCILNAVSSPDNYFYSLSLQPLKALCNISLSSLVKMSLQISVMLIPLAPCFWPEVKYIALLEQMGSGFHREAEIAWLSARSTVLAAARAPTKESSRETAPRPCKAGGIVWVCFESKRVQGCSSADVCAAS